MLPGPTQDSKSMRYPYPPLLPPQSVRSKHQGSTLTFHLATGEDLLRTNRKESFPRLSGQGKLPFLLPCPSPHHVRLTFDSHSKNSAVTTQKDATGRKQGMPENWGDGPCLPALRVDPRFISPPVVGIHLWILASGLSSLSLPYQPYQSNSVNPSRMYFAAL